MLKLVSVIFAVSAVAAAVNFEYLDNGIEYDVSPNVISGVPYPYHGGFISNRVMNIEPSSEYTAAVIESEEPKSAIVATKLGLLATVSFAIAIIKKAVWFAIKNWSALILGSSIALGVCKFTPLCNKHSLIELQREIRSLATPQRVARAAEFVENAIRKYSAMQ